MPVKTPQNNPQLNPLHALLLALFSDHYLLETLLLPNRVYAPHSNPILLAV
jgi:acyl-CoA thioesterase